MKSILLVEDDTSLGETLYDRLSKLYKVQWVKTFKQAWTVVVQSDSFDLILLDVGLPDGNGFDLALKIKNRMPSHFMFLTARSDAESRLQGFELGAEEYIPKPFHLRELLLRVKHVFEAHHFVEYQSSDQISDMKTELSSLVIDFNEMSIRKKNGAIQFIPLNDMKALKLLIKKSPQVVSRDQIIDEVWGQDKNPSPRSIDNMIVRIRQVLSENPSDDKENHIRSVRGVGYQWVKHL